MPSRRTIRRSLMVGLALAMLAAAGSVSAEHGSGTVDGSCSPDGAFSIEEGTSYGVQINYANDTSSDVTFISTMRENDFHGAEHTFHSRTFAGPDIGVVVQIHVSTAGLPETTDEVRIDITSSATGSTILGSCVYDLTVLPRDTDDDALADRWETTGVDGDNDGVADLTLAGANPMRKDIYLELDYMELHEPRAEAIQDVIDAFSAAPVVNPDGSTGVSLHIEIDEQVPHVDDITTWTDFDAIKTTNFGTVLQRPSAAVIAAKRLASRYQLWGHARDGDSSSGLAEIGGNDSIITLGADGWGLNDAGAHTVGTRAQQAGTLMHEFGHNLNLEHGGDEGINCKPNYVSIMNYSFQTGWVPQADGTARLDYSGADLDDLDESALDESTGINDGADFTFWTPDGTKTLTGRGDGALDWNGDTTAGNDGSTTMPDAGTVAVDINARDTRGCGKNWDGTANPSPGETLTGHNDWTNIDYDFRDDDEAADGLHSESPIELDAETYHAFEEETDAALGPNADPGGPYSAVEGSPVSVSGTATDPDDDDALITYTWDFGDGTTASGQTASHTYGDDGVYTLTLTATDPGGRTGSASTTVTVSNLDPTATLDMTGAVDTAGGPVFLGRSGVPQTHAADGTDPGSDDLTFDWSFGGLNTHFNDGVGPDPDLSSGGTYPFSANDSAVATFAPGVQLVGVTVSDDDGGDASDAATKLVTGASPCTNGLGWWKHQFGTKGSHQMSDATLDAYLDVVGFASGYFSEVRAASTIAEARNVLSSGGSDMRDKAAAHLLAAWLDFADGGIGWDELVDTDDDGVADSSFDDVVAAVATTLSDAGATHGELVTAKNLAQSVTDHRSC